MAGSGPAPSLNPKRSNPRVGVQVLPAQCKKPIPRWPLIEDLRLSVEKTQRVAAIADLEFIAEDEDLTPARRARLDQKIAAERGRLAVVEEKLSRQKGLELGVWRKLWRSPQAEAWHNLGWIRDVATYARLSVLAEMGDLEALKEARMWSDRLGLTPKAMRALLWVVAADEVKEKRQEREDGDESTPTAPRRRLSAVDPTAG